MVLYYKSDFFMNGGYNEINREHFEGNLQFTWEVSLALIGIISFASHTTGVPTWLQTSGG